MHYFDKNIEFLFNRSITNEALIIRLFIKYKKLIFGIILLNLSLGL